jgi:hypothetical protein
MSIKYEPTRQHITRPRILYHSMMASGRKETRKSGVGSETWNGGTVEGVILGDQKGGNLASFGLSRQLTICLRFAFANRY